MIAVSTKAQAHAELDAEELYALARIDFEKGNLELALRKLKLVLTEVDPLPEALALGARVYAQLRLSDRASALFKRYLVKQPDAIDEMFQLGMLNFEGGNVKEALAQWSDVLEKNPSYPPALFFSGLALAKEDKIVDAKRSLNILLQSTAADNLYFNQARDLLQTIENNLQGIVPAAGLDVPAGASFELPYGSKH
jgi:tetratricopeptide (TPR) repeat protein